MRSLLSILLVLCAWTGVSQTGHPGETNLGAALRTIEQRYVVNIAYSAAALDLDSPVVVPPGYSLTTDLNTVLSPLGLTYVKIGPQYVVTVQNLATKSVTGFVEDASNRERLVGAVVYAISTQRGVSSNGYGYFSLTELAPDERVVVRYLGYAPDTLSVADLTSGTVKVRLNPNLELLTVQVTQPVASNAPISLDGIAMGPAALGRSQLLNGQRDVNSWLSLQTGVQSAANGYRGYGIRGADPEHNLTLLDDANLYLPSHAVGYLSVVPGRALRSFRLYRNAGPSRYGDRVGGVLDLRLREGNRLKRESSLDLGLIDVSATTEGPVGRGSYFVSGRRALSDFWLDIFRPAERVRLEGRPEISFGFYDVAAKVNQQLTDRQQIYASLFIGRDRYRDAASGFAATPDEITGYTDRSSRVWQNVLGSVRHSIAYGDRWFANSTLTVSDFRVNARDESETTVQPTQRTDSVDLSRTRKVYDSQIRDLGFKSDLQYALTASSIVTIGMDATLHRFALTSASQSVNGDTEPGIRNLAPVSTLDLSTYISYDYRPSDDLEANVGVRFSSQISRSQPYFVPLPRASIRYRTGWGGTISAAIAQSRQYVHRIGTNNPGLPRDLWVPTIRGLTPLSNTAADVTVGYELVKGTGVSVGAYVSRLRGLARFDNDYIGSNYDDWIGNLRTGQGRAAGLEFTLRHERDRYSIQAGYTLGSSTRRFEDGLGRLAQEAERARLDRRHFATLLTEAQVAPRIVVSAAVRGGSGLPARIPRNSASVDGVLPTDLPLTNSWDYDGATFDIAGFFSADLGVEMYVDPATKRQRISLGAQNVTLRRNPLFINLREVPDPLPAQSLNEFTEVFAPGLLPYLRYARKF